MNFITKLFAKAEVATVDAIVQDFAKVADKLADHAAAKATEIAQFEAAVVAAQDAAKKAAAEAERAQKIQAKIHDLLAL